MSRETADIYNPKTIRSTMGSIYGCRSSMFLLRRDVSAAEGSGNPSVCSTSEREQAWYDEDYRKGSLFDRQ